MGLFQQRSEEEENQWVLPSEPLEREAADALDAAPAVDPMDLGVGLGLGLGDPASVSSIVFPVAPVLTEPGSDESGEPERSGDSVD